MLGFNSIEQDSFIAEHDVLFFSETWSVSPFSSRKHFNFVSCDAAATGGRPSGGLEMYWADAQNQAVLSKSPHHICIRMSLLQIIGVYYQPTLEFDDLIIDLVTALSSCSPDLPILLGGDFNLHATSPDFRHLLQILHCYNISLVSDPDVITFDGPQGSSSPDHVFCSASHLVSSVRVKTCPRVESSHYPLSVELHLKGKRSDSVSQVDKFPTERVDTEQCKRKLQQILVDVDQQQPDVLAEKICEAFSSSMSHRQKNNRNVFSHKIAQLKSETKEAFKLYQRYGGAFLKDVYLRCRRIFHAEIRVHKQAMRSASIAKLIESTQTNGIRALYKPAKRFSPSSSTISLQDWFRFFSELYQSFDEPTFKAFAFPPTEESSRLVAPFSTSEIKDALDHQSSAAVGLNGVSPLNLKGMSDLLAPLLAKVYTSFLTGNSIPAAWLSSVFFFLHKKGSMSDPNNYRSLAIEDPFLKVFTTALTRRISDYAEKHHLLPEYQFGFRKSLSTSSAVAVLKECIESAFRNKKRIYACFVDYKKAFDLVNRARLTRKLQIMGLPVQLCRVIFDLLAGLRLRVRANDALSPEFPSFNGVPQGDSLSPLLYTLYTADLPATLSHRGVQLGQNDIVIKYLLYADDLVLLSHSRDDLQSSINALERYADQNELTVNIAKTKCMVFHRGFCPPFTCYYKGSAIETCKQFTYLGVVLTTQLSAGQHARQIISKCNQRIGYLFVKLPLKDIPLSVLIDIFNTYVLPIVQYALPLWFPKLSKEGRRSLNSMFTKFLKRYLGVPWATHNGLVHYVTGTIPLCCSLEEKTTKFFHKICYPQSLSGVRLTVPNQTLAAYNNFENVPSFFWYSPILKLPLPSNPEIRRALVYDAFDLHHRRMCSRLEHHDPGVLCVCDYCGYSVDRYHFRLCPAVRFKSACGRLKFLMSERHED
jgi:hypothetical protein